MCNRLGHEHAALRQANAILSTNRRRLVTIFTVFEGRAAADAGRSGGPVRLAPDHARASVGVPVPGSRQTHGPPAFLRARQPSAVFRGTDFPFPNKDPSRPAGQRRRPAVCWSLTLVAGGHVPLAGEQRLVDPTSINSRSRFENGL